MREPKTEQSLFSLASALARYDDLSVARVSIRAKFVS